VSSPSPFATEVAKLVLDAVEPMFLRIREEQRDFEQRIDRKLRESHDPVRINHAHSFVKGIAYLAGAIVTHRGGCWQALDNTGDEPGDSGMWRLLANGLWDISGFVDEADPRLLTITNSMASGERINLEVRLPLPIHRGRWEATTIYQQGDEVALGGSSWRAVRNDVGSKPPGPDWLLVAQKAKGPMVP